MSFEKLPPNERRAINSILDAIKDLDDEEPVKVEVFGERERDYAGGFDRAKILAHIGNTDVTDLRLFSTQINGQITMLHGEGDDFIQDISGETEADLEKIERLLP
jgi:hypothetical protein